MKTLDAATSVAVCFHASIAGAEALAQRLAGLVRERGIQAWVDALPVADSGLMEEEFGRRLEAVDLLVCVGGDGTVLHASAYAALTETPIFGVRMGRLGFLTETVEETAEDDLLRVLDGGVRVERRSMLSAQVGEAPPMHALNDVVLGRATLGQTVSIGARIDGVVLAEYRADAVLVSTATGSTGYALSVGGPILHPESDEIVLVPIAPHLTRANPLVLPGDARLRLSVERGYEAVITVDGLRHRPLEPGVVVEVTKSPRSADFVRLGGANQFYANVARRLGWLRSDHVMGDADDDGAR